MARPKQPKDAERVRFIAPYGSRDLYTQVAELKGMRLDWWISGVLHAEALKVLKAHDKPTNDVPPAHLTRPPRIQPPMNHKPKKNP